ncbi:TRAP transporter large permease subunit, partial [bacterium]|nr:TRAP transporter large permease subunit [bacterium]
MTEGTGPEAAGHKATKPLGPHQLSRLLIATALAVYVLVEVSIPKLPPLGELAVFGGFGLVLCFLGAAVPAGRVAAAVNIVLAVLSALCCGYLVLQSETLGQRAALYTTPDLIVGGLGMLLVLEAARRSVGWSLPILAMLFLLYAHESVARSLPDWLFPHRGQDLQAIIGQSWLRSEGVFGTAMGVMFRYVFLFVLFGAVLEAAGATGWVIGVAQRLFGKRAGGPAKVAVLASGLMGSLSGSAVANAATTGTFTIPLMRGIGFSPAIAAGIEAAASSGGALVPPVMGAGAYMMLEIINRDPPVRFLEIVQAAIVPAILYYLSIFLLVHFYARRIDEASGAPTDSTATDAVDGDLSVDVTTDADTLAVFPLGTTTVTFSVTDSDGGVAEASSTVTVVDTTAPDVSFGGELTLLLSADANGLPVTDSAIAGYLALFSGIDIVSSADLDITNNAPAVFPVESQTTVTLTATDAAGNSASLDVTIVVSDTAPPTFASTGPINLEANTLGGLAYTEAELIAAVGISDNVAAAGDISVVVTPAVAAVLPLGSTTFTVTATDTAEGKNTSAAEVVVTVVDTTPPKISGANLTDLQALSPEPIPSTDSRIQDWVATITAEDVVDGPIALDETNIFLPIDFQIGDNPVTVSVADAAGNVTETTIFTVTVLGNDVAPIVTAPTGITVEA